jgi:GT2 family glycosyltransferase
VPKLTFQIVNYNTKNLLSDCINNLLGIYPDMEIIVVDNSSTDGSAQMIKEKFADKVTFLEQDNKGLASGYNLGFTKATGDIIVYIGTDAYPTAEALKKLIDYVQSNPQVGICTPKLVLRDGSVDMDAHRGFPTPWTSLARFTGLSNMFPKSKFFGHYFLSYLDTSTRHEIDMCIAHFMIVPRKVVGELNGWDEDFFLYGEDVDFCYRVKEKGYKVMYLGDVEVLHYKGAGVGRSSSKDIKTASNSSKEVLSKVPYYTIDAMKLFVNKHYKNKYPQWLINFMFLGMKTLLALRKLIAKIKTKL